MKFRSPLEAFLYWEEKHPNQIMFHQPLSGGKVRIYTRSEAGNEIRRVAEGLRALNLPKKSKVALLSKNCAHWIMADLAIMMTGHISVPLYPTLDAASITMILEHSEAAAIFLGKLDDYASQRSGVIDIPKIGFNLFGMEDGVAWDELVSKHAPISSLAEQDPDQLISILYTSGTTGIPKGVMHSVSNFTCVANAYLEVLPAVDKPRYISYLPLAHVAERVGIEMQGLFRGVTFYFAESLESFASDLANAQPNMFFAVPRIWAKFQQGILAKMPQKKLDRMLSIPILSTLVRKKIQKKLGLSKADYIVSGAAPLAVELIKWYEKLGIKIHQVYGMTEDCILSHYNLPNSSRLGSVGKPVAGVKSKLSSEGEICVKNEALMKGYYKNPDMTAAMFDEEGFLKTGDIGEYDHDGFLYITGRVKDQFKTDKGKYISPAPIELELTKNTDIEQVCVVGMGIPQPIALVVPSESGKSKSKEQLAESLESSIQRVNPDLPKHEKLAKAVVMKEEWSVDNGLLTPTLKTKRNQIEKIHMPMYKSWFNTEDLIIFE